VAISHQSWESILLESQGSPILPKLTHLTWWKTTEDHISLHSQLQYCQELIHPGLKTLWVGVPNANSFYLPPLLRHMKLHAAGIEYLSLQCKLLTLPESVGNPLCNMLEDLRLLRKIALPGYWLTPSVFTTLSKLPLLSTIEQDLFGYLNSGMIFRLMPLPYSQLEQDAFFSLERLTLAINVKNMDFLRHPHYPQRLTHLMLHCPYETPRPADVQHMLKTLSASSPALQSLRIDLRVDRFEEDEEDAHMQPPLSTFSPISGFKFLEHFDFEYQVPLQYTSAELASFAPNLHKLRHLNFNAAPFYTVHRQLPNLDVLRIFAQHCPQLEFLGLCVVVNELALSIHTTPDEAHAFDHPMHLNMGTSMIENELLSNVALFIAQTCPFGCEITSGYTREPAAIELTFDEGDAHDWEYVNEKVAKARHHRLCDVDAIIHTDVRSYVLSSADHRRSGHRPG
jgi:hypothetical protein